jgi:hypothetical protein
MIERSRGLKTAYKPIERLNGKINDNFSILKMIIHHRITFHQIGKRETRGAMERFDFDVLGKI